MYMKTRKRLACSTIALTLLFGLASTALVLGDGNKPKETPTAAKVVYHADYGDPARFSAMLTSIFNMATTYENEFIDYDIRIVFLSQGIKFLTTDRLKGTALVVDDEQAKLREPLLIRLKTLHEMQHINLSLCEITLEAVGLDKAKLIPGVQLVNSGVVEIAKLQSQGFSYLKVQ